MKTIPRYFRHVDQFYDDTDYIEVNDFGVWSIGKNRSIDKCRPLVSLEYCLRAVELKEWKEVFISN